MSVGPQNDSIRSVLLPRRTERCDLPAETAPDISPAKTYAERRTARQDEVGHWERRHDALGRARVGTVAVALLLGWLAFAFWWPIAFALLLPAGVFVFLVYRFDAVGRRLARARRAVRFYERGLDRLADRWAGRGEHGQRYLDEQHLYAAGLDVFGRGSLYERLCNARTRPGEDTLASWLLAPAAPAEVRARQEAVADLTPRLDLREDLALLGAEVPPVEFSPLVAWGEAPPVVFPRRARLLLGVLGTLNVAAALAWLVFGLPSLPLAVTLLASGVVALWLRSRVRQVLEPIERMRRDLGLLAGLLGRLEREPYTALRLRQLEDALRAEGRLPSEQLLDLASLMDWLHAARNGVFIPIALLLLWHTQMALSFEVWRRRSGHVLRHWLEAIGTIEALGALAGYAYENPEDAFPEVVPTGPIFDAEGLGHPLLPRDRCVVNDVRLGDDVRLMVVSGSNMSGKSTLLRSVGVATVLALAGGPVRARRLRLSPLAVCETMRVQDSLLGGRSRFFAEITRVRQIMDRTAGPLPVLFLLDELFHGTNSHDRSVGAEAVLRHLLDAGTVGLVTTHDLSLTRIVDQLGGHAQNVHFADQFLDGKMVFDYRMHAGVVPHSNALALMRAVGLEV